MVSPSWTRATIGGSWPAGRRRGRPRARPRPTGPRGPAPTPRRRPPPCRTAAPATPRPCLGPAPRDRRPGRPPSARRGWPGRPGAGRRGPSPGGRPAPVLPGRRARVSGCRAQAATRSARPAMIPAWGPPSSLSPEKVTRAAPAASVWRAAGSSASHAGGPPASHGRGRVEEAGADVGHHRRAERGQGGHLDRLGEADDPVVRLVDLEEQGHVPALDARPGSRPAGCGWWCRPPPGGRPTGPSPRAPGSRRRSPPARPATPPPRGRGPGRPAPAARRRRRC